MRPGPGSQLLGPPAEGQEVRPGRGPQAAAPHHRLSQVSPPAERLGPSRSLFALSPEGRPRSPGSQEALVCRPHTCSFRRRTSALLLEARACVMVPAARAWIEYPDGPRGGRPRSPASVGCAACPRGGSAHGPAWIPRPGLWAPPSFHGDTSFQACPLWAQCRPPRPEHRLPWPSSLHATAERPLWAD